MNYLTSFIVCLFGTSCAVLNKNPDIPAIKANILNVAVALALAWFLDGKQKSIQLNIVHWRRDEVDNKK